jgi:hypothetical protein
MKESLNICISGAYPIEIYRDEYDHLLGNGSVNTAWNPE